MKRRTLLTVLLGLSLVVGYNSMPTCSAEGSPDETYNPTIHPADFVGTINNPYLPLLTP